MFFTSALISADFALETTLATSHAELIFEEMRSKEAIQEITFVDWNEWLKKQDVSLLPEEAVEISYLDPAKSPFPVSMKVSWRGRARIQTQEFYTTFIK